MGLFDEARAGYAAFIEGYQASSEPRNRSQVARALLNRAHSRFEEIVERFGESEDPRGVETVASALISKAGLELGVGRTAGSGESARLGPATCGEDPPEQRAYCHLAIATAHLVNLGKEPGEREIATILTHRSIKDFADSLPIDLASSDRHRS